MNEADGVEGNLFWSSSQLSEKSPIRVFVFSGLVCNGPNWKFDEPITYLEQKTTDSERKPAGKYKSKRIWHARNIISV